MPWRQKRCKQCGHIGDDVSNRHLCRKCAIENIKQSCHQIRDKQGPTYEKYREGVLKYLGLENQLKEGDKHSKSWSSQGK